MTDAPYGIGYIYGIRNKITGLMYVGASKQLRTRIAQHYRMRLRSRHVDACPRRAKRLLWQNISGGSEREHRMGNSASR